MLIYLDNLLLDTDIIRKVRSYEVRKILSFIHRRSGAIPYQF